METPKEKAQSLFAKYQNIESERYPLGMDDEDAYECAKVAVEEIRKDYSSYRIKRWVSLDFALEMKEYWDEVLRELEKS